MKARHRARPPSPLGSWVLGQFESERASSPLLTARILCGNALAAENSTVYLYNMSTSTQAPVTAKLNVPETSLPPEAANWFHFGMANLDVQMLVGYIDPRQAAEFAQAVRSGRTDVPPITPMVTRRIMLSLSGFMHLRGQVHEMELKMQAAGVELPDGEFPTLSRKTNG